MLLALANILEGVLPNLPVMTTTYNFQGNVLRAIKEKQAVEEKKAHKENYLKEILLLLNEESDLSGVKVQCTSLENSEVTQGVERALACIEAGTPFKEVKITLTMIPNLDLIYSFHEQNQGTFSIASMPEFIFRFNFKNKHLVLSFEDEDVGIKIRSKFQESSEKLTVWGQMKSGSWKILFRFNGTSLKFQLHDGNEVWRLNVARFIDFFSVFETKTEITDETILSFFLNQLQVGQQIYNFLRKRQATGGKLNLAYNRYDFREDGMPEVDVVVILKDKSEGQIEELENAYFEYVDGLKDRGCRDIGVTFWNA